MLAALLAAAVAGFTPAGAVLEGDAAAGISAWLPATESPVAMRALIAADVPLAMISRADRGAYDAFLSDGHRALLDKVPDYRLTVYPSRRVAFFPEAVNGASLRNAGTARLKGHDSIGGATLGLPFLRPRTGMEAMWNHRLRYRGDSLQLRSKMVIVDADGPGRPVWQRKLQLNTYANLASRTDPSMLWYLYRAQSGSRYPANYLVLLHEPLRTRVEDKAVWIRQQGGRMLRVAVGALDIGTTPSQGLLTLDMYDMYGGEADYRLYTWKLRGVRPLLVPYNATALADGAVPHDELLAPHRPDPRFLRHEMHRVWVVEATLLKKQTHLFARRVFYVDEDSWNIVVAENYLADGTLARLQECSVVQDFQHAVPECRPMIVYDLPGERYLVDDLLTSAADRILNVRGLTAADFSPARVKNADNP